MSLGAKGEARPPASLRARGDSASLAAERPRAGWLRRRRNRRLSYRSRSPLAWLAEAGAGVWQSALRVARFTAKVALVLLVGAACLYGARLGIRHVVASPRFQLQTIEFVPTPHLRRADVTALAGVAVGDRLLSIDTDAVAARIASHPWVKQAYVSRRLPGCLVVEASERRAAAVVALDGLYLIDESGRPFKRATMDEADGLPVLTGIERATYARLREASEAAYREALALLAQYRTRPGRPAVGEISIDPGFGFSLLLFEGGTEIRLGRGNYSKKLAQLDRIFEALTARGMLSMLKIVHLDLPESGRVPVLLRQGAEPPTPQKPTPSKLAKT